MTDSQQSRVKQTVVGMAKEEPMIIIGVPLWIILFTIAYLYDSTLLLLSIAVLWAMGWALQWRYYDA